MRVVSICTLFSLLFASHAFWSFAEEQPVLGRIEYALLAESKLKLKARIDTGAGVSAVDSEIVEIKKDKGQGKERAVFIVSDKEGKFVTLERDIVEWINIKGKAGHPSVRRPVVKLAICLDNQLIEARVSLADRDAYLYPLLVGRNALKMGRFLVDPRLKFHTSPKCD